MSITTPTGEPLPQGMNEDPLAHYTRLFTRFLQLVFASFEKGSYQWCEDLELTDVVIQNEGTATREVLEKRPAIIVSRGTVRAMNLMTDQFAGPTFDKKTGRLIRNQDNSIGSRRHTDLYAATVEYNCLSSAGLEAQRIAWTCGYATRVLKRALMHAGVHRVGEDFEVGKETPPGSIIQGDPGEIILVPVLIPFYFQQTWTNEPTDKVLLNKVSIALRSEVGYSEQEQAPVLRDPGLNGHPLLYDRLVPITQAVGSTSSGGSQPK